MLKQTFRILVILSVFCTGWSSPLHAEDNGAGTPVMVFDEAAGDPPTVVRGEIATHVFTFSNKGSAPLILSDVSPGCRCTETAYDKTVLPGRKGRITLTMDTEGFTGRTGLDAVVTSNDPETPNRKIEVAVMVLPLIDLQPDRVILSGPAGKVLEKTLVIRSNIQDPLQLGIDEETVPPEITCVLSPKEPGKSYLLTVRNKNETPNVYRRTFQIKTNYARRPTLKVPVFGRILSEVEVTPKSVDFGQIRRKRYAALMKNPDEDPGPAELSSLREELAKDVFVRGNVDQPLEIERVEIDQTLFHTEVKSLELGKHYWIRITPLPARLKSGLTETRLKIHTNHPRFSTLVVPLRVMAN